MLTCPSQSKFKDLREYDARNNYHVVKEYVDEAENGRSIDRPGSRNMITTAKLKTPPFTSLYLVSFFGVGQIS